MEIGKLYKIDAYYSPQRWYSTSTFQLLEVTENKMLYFGTDCVWLNLETGEIENSWNRYFIELSIEELRDFKLKKLKI